MFSDFESKYFGRFLKIAKYVSRRTFRGKVVLVRNFILFYRFHALSGIFGTFTKKICRVVKLTFFNCSGAFSRGGSLVDKKIGFLNVQKLSWNLVKLFAKRFQQVFHNSIRCVQRTKLKKKAFLDNSHFNIFPGHWAIN